MASETSSPSTALSSRPSQVSRPNYTLYLVTDVTDAILGGRDLVEQVRDAVTGGATIVQHRDKQSSTAELVRDSRALHAVTLAAGVPLIINDRLDVALAVGAEGVHLGQDDMDLASARKILGPDKLIGISVGTVEEARAAIAGGADYIGIGTMFGTQTKKDTRTIIGTNGTQTILAAVARAERKAGRKIGTVAIGGINATNAQRVVYQSANQEGSGYRALDGIAVVSALMGAEDAKKAATDLRRLVAQAETAPFATLVYPPEVPTNDLLAAYVGRDVPEVIKRLRKDKPLCHNMTNLVVQNFAANVALAIGGSPIMANDGAEAEDLARLEGSLVINMGSATPGAIEHASRAVAAYNSAGGPVLFDPVGAGATKIRRDAVKKLLAAGYYDIIKGNESEILSVTKTISVTTEQEHHQQQQQRGVDSSSGGLSLLERARVVRELAERRRCIVVMTGREDFASDGVRVFQINNGESVLGDITGSGCALGTTIAAMAAVEKQDKLLATVAGLLLYEIAAQKAVETGTKHGDLQGPGTFVPLFLDCLSQLSKMTAADDVRWLQKAKIEAVEVLTNGVCG